MSESQVEAEVLVQLHAGHRMTWDDAKKAACGQTWNVLRHDQSDDTLLLDAPGNEGQGLWFPRAACVVDEPGTT